MSDSSSVQLYYTPEVTWGTTPSGSPLPSLREFRFTNESLNQTTESTESEEIRSDRQVSDIIRTLIGCSGEVGIESSYGAHDDLLEALLCGTWSTATNLTGVTATFTINSPALTGTVSVPSASPNPFRNVSVGQALHVTSGANQGVYTVTAITDGDTVVIQPAPASASAYATNLRFGSMLKNGAVRRSFTIEKHFADLSPEQRMIFSGMRIGSGSQTISPGEIVAGNWSFMGKGATVQGPTVGNGVPTAAATNNVMNAVDNITNILIDGLSPGAGVYFTEVSWELDNSLREQPAIGSLTNIGIGYGRTHVTGTIASYFQNRTMLDKYLNFTQFGLSFNAVDSAGNRYVYHFPALKLSSGEAPTGGNDQDVVVNLEFMAKRHPTFGYMLGITRIPVS